MPRGRWPTRSRCASSAFGPREVQPGLFAMAMNTEDSLREYLRVVVRIPLVGRIGPLARTFDFVADAAPGVKEILAIGKMCYEVRERHYDLVVVDAEASGHIVAQIDAPRAIRELVQVGWCATRPSGCCDILGDPRRTGLVVVTTPEEMPVTETLELVDNVRSTTDVDVAAVFANRVLPRWFDPGEQAVFDPVVRTRRSGRLGEVAGRQGEHGVRSGAAGRGTPWHGRRVPRTSSPGAAARMCRCAQIPELFTKASGRRVVSLVADELHTELL